MCPFLQSNNFILSLFISYLHISLQFGHIISFDILILVFSLFIVLFIENTNIFIFLFLFSGSLIIFSSLSFLLMSFPLDIKYILFISKFVLFVYFSIISSNKLFKLP